MGPVSKRQIVFNFSLLFAFLLAVQIVVSLSALKSTIEPEKELIRIALALGAFLFPILGTWYSFGLAGGIILAFISAIMAFFAIGVSSTSLFGWFIFEYAAFCFVLMRFDQIYENQTAATGVDREHYQNEKNDLEVAHKTKGEGISILFEKYSTYYNLRKLAEELAGSLSVSALAEMIVSRSYEFVGRGDSVMLSLADTGGTRLSVAGFKWGSRTQPKPVFHYEGDLFDFWVIKNQRRLIVNDIQQDFRFDVNEASRLQDVRSLIIAPVIHERRIIGTLRIQSAARETFSNDDLRLLDTIAVLASSALSNAMLFEQTEELAIRDSMTNLYVRRYFFDRLKEEHRRALLTQRPLSLLMCDLDHFKECNDRHGHAVGDLMLMEFANILRQNCESAIVARYGGEEFSILLPETPKEDAAALADKIRAAVEHTPFVVRRQRISMTVSIGVSNFPQDTLDVETLVERADQALYQAKKQGRNRVCSSALPAS